MGKIIDVNGELTTLAAVLPAAKTETFDSTGIDISGYDGILKVTQTVGAIAGTDTPKLSGKLEHSSDNVTYVDVDGATFTDVVAANKIQSIGVNTRSLKKYIRYTGTIAGTTPSFTMAVTVTGQQQYI